MLEFLLTNHPAGLPGVDKGGECELQDMVFRYGAIPAVRPKKKFIGRKKSGRSWFIYDAPRLHLASAACAFCDEAWT